MSNRPINKTCLAEDIRQALLRRAHLDGPLKPAIEEYVRRVAIEAARDLARILEDSGYCQKPDVVKKLANTFWE